MPQAGGSHLPPHHQGRRGNAGRILHQVRAGARDQDNRRHDRADGTGRRDDRAPQRRHALHDGERRFPEQSRKRRRARAALQFLQTHGRGAEERAEKEKIRQEGRAGGAGIPLSLDLYDQSDGTRAGGQARPDRRAGPRDGARDPDPQPPSEEQSVPDRRAGRRQNGDRRGAGPADCGRAGAVQAEKRGRMPRGPDRARGGDAVPGAV